MWKAFCSLFVAPKVEPRKATITVDRNGSLLLVEVWINGSLYRCFDFMVDQIVHVGHVDAHIVGKHSYAWHFTVHINGARKMFGVTLPISNTEMEQVHFCDEITKARKQFIRHLQRREHERF